MNKTKAVAKAGAGLLAEMPSPLQSYLQRTLAQIAEVGDDPETLWAVAQRGFEMEMAGRIIAGRALLELSKRLDKADFVAQLSVRGMSRRAYFNAIAVYQAFTELPDVEAVQAFALLGQSKAIAVLTWAPEERLAFARGEKVRGITVDQAVEMSAREFAEAARDPELVKAQKKLAALEADREGLQAEVKELKGALKHRYESLKMPDFAAHARQEGVALSEQMMLSLTALEDVVTDHLNSKQAISVEPEWRERAAGTVYHSIRAVYARTQALLQRLEEEFGTPVTGKIDYEHELTEGELLLAKDALSVILKRHQAQASNREAVRKNAKGERGRPRKLKDES